jgi:hypothetical protein
MPMQALVGIFDRVLDEMLGVLSIVTVSSYHDQISMTIR